MLAIWCFRWLDFASKIARFANTVRGSSCACVSCLIWWGGWCNLSLSRAGENSLGARNARLMRLVCCGCGGPGHEARSVRVRLSAGERVLSPTRRSCFSACVCFFVCGASSEASHTHTYTLQNSVRVRAGSWPPSQGHKTKIIIIIITTASSSAINSE